MFDAFCGLMTKCKNFPDESLDSRAMAFFSTFITDEERPAKVFPKFE